jgi:hypothetical protein
MQNSDWQSYLITILPSNKIFKTLIFLDRKPYPRKNLQFLLIKRNCMFSI